MGLFHTINRTALEEVLHESEARKANSGFEKTELRFIPIDFGSMKLILLPPYSEKGLVFKKVFYHRNLPNKGVEEGKVLCPDFTDRERCCPICHALRMLRSNNNVKVDKWKERAKTYTNAIVYDVNGAPLDTKKYPNPELPHILIGPSKFADFIAAKGLDPDFSDFASVERGALPLKITKTKTGNEVFDVEYQFDFLPNRRPLADSPEKLEEVAKGIYDLDKIFHYSEKAYTEAMQYANRILERLGFAVLDPTDYPPLPAKFKAKAKENSDGSSTPKVQETAATPTPLVQGPTTEAPKPVQSTPAGTEPTRNYTIIDAATNRPVCSGWHNMSAICASCPFEDTCVIDTANRVASAG